MYLSVKKPRKTDRKRSIRHRAKVKAKNRTRRGRVTPTRNPKREPPGLHLKTYA